MAFIASKTELLMEVKKMINDAKDKTFPGTSSETAIMLAQEALEKCMKEHGYMTIRMFHEALGLPEVEGTAQGYDPDEWGWDEKGFRQLFCTVVERRRL